MSVTLCDKRGSIAARPPNGFEPTRFPNGALRRAASSRATIDENRIGAAVTTNSSSLLFRNERSSPNCTTTCRPRSA